MNRPFVCGRWLGKPNKQYILNFPLLQDFQCYNLYYYSIGCSARSLCDFGLLQFLTDFITDFITDKLLLLVVVYLRVLIVHKCKYKI
jgi:hypothetical protein